jgi:uncharacterized membrane protein (UPF0127 family)
LIQAAALPLQRRGALPVQGLAAAVGLAGCVALQAVFHIQRFPSWERWADLTSFLAAGTAVRAGVDPYLGGLSQENLNPPVLLPAFALLAALPPTAAYVLVYSASFLLYATCGWLLVRRADNRLPTSQVIALAALSGFWDTLLLGQIYVLLLAPLTLAWLSVERQPGRAGALVGFLAAAKPNLLLVPALLVLAGHRKTAATACVAALIVSALPVAWYGWEIYPHWWAAATTRPTVWYPLNGSLVGELARLGWAEMGFVAAGMLVVGLAAWSWRCRPDPRSAMAAGLAGALLIGPLTWTGYAVLLLPILATRRWGHAERRAVALLVLPAFALLDTSLAGPVPRAILGGVYPAAFALLLGTTVLRRGKPAPHVVAVDNASIGSRLAAHAEVARGPVRRGLGLMGRRGWSTSDGLILPRCNAIHCFFMRMPIDVVYVDKSGRVVKALRDLRPWRIGPISLGTDWVLELPEGTLERTRTSVGDLLVVRPVGVPA